MTHLDDLERGRLLADDGCLALVDRGRILLGVHAVDTQTTGAVNAGREAVAVPEKAITQPVTGYVKLISERRSRMLGSKGVLATSS